MPQSSQASRPTLFTLSELVAPVRAPRKVYQLIIISPSLIKYMLPCSRLETLSLSLMNLLLLILKKRQPWEATASTSSS